MIRAVSHLRRNGLILRAGALGQMDISMTLQKGFHHDDGDCLGGGGDRDDDCGGGTGDLDRMGISMTLLKGFYRAGDDDDDDGDDDDDDDDGADDDEPRPKARSEVLDVDCRVWQSYTNFLGDDDGDEDDDDDDDDDDE